MLLHPGGLIVISCFLLHIQSHLLPAAPTFGGFHLTEWGQFGIIAVMEPFRSRHAGSSTQVRSKRRDSKGAAKLADLSGRFGLPRPFSPGTSPDFPALSCTKILHFSKSLPGRGPNNLIWRRIEAVITRTTRKEPPSWPICPEDLAYLGRFSLVSLLIFLPYLARKSCIFPKAFQDGVLTI